MSTNYYQKQALHAYIWSLLCFIVMFLQLPSVNTGPRLLRIHSQHRARGGYAVERSPHLQAV